MPRFTYTAMDANGSETQGTIEAESRAKAVAQIRAKNLFPTQIAEAGGGKRQGGPRKPGGAKQEGLKREIKMPAFFQGRVKAKDLMSLTRQLATLIDAGLPLLRGLRILLKQAKKPAMREALGGMGESVEGGSTFSEALAQYPRIFDNLYVNMVRAGEAGGVLETVLLRLAEFMEKAERIKNKVKSAMIYPVVVMIAAVGILTFLMVFIIPRFHEIFTDLLGGRSLPALTQFVIDVSNFVAARWYIVFGGIVGIVVLAKVMKRTTWGAAAVDRVKLRMPLFGHLFRLGSVARFARTLGTLMASGVPVLQALDIVRDTAGNQVIADAIQAVHDAVKEGDSMAQPMEASGVFPDMVISMVDVGEETGALPEMLVRVADAYDDEVDTTVEGLTSVIEPIMIVVLALVIGTIVIAMFIPLISIISEMATAG